MHKLHSIEAFVPENKTYIQNYTQFSLDLQVARLFIHLSRQLQIHRGATMGWLSGQSLFSDRVAASQTAVLRLFALVRSRVRESDCAVSDSELRNLQNDWQTILVGWKNDRPMHNFEFHGHLIDRLLRLLRLDFQQAMVASWNDADKHSLAMLDLCFSRIPELAELLAQARGLSTHVAVNKTCAHSEREKIAFLIDCAIDSHRQLRAFSTDHALGFNPPRGFKSRYEKLLRDLRANIVDAEKIDVASSDVYNTSTDVIDQLWMMVDWHLHSIEKAITESILIE